MKRIIVTAAALLISAGAQAQVLGFGSAPAGSLGYNQASAIAKVLAEKAGIQSRVQPHSGSSAVIPLVNSGELDLTVCNVLEAEEASHGTGPYKGRKQENLRVLGVIFPLYSSLFVRKDSPIKTIADVKGKRVAWGYTAQVTLNTVVGAVLANGGLTGKDIVPVLVPNVVRGADDFAEGKVDAGFFALGAGKVSEVDKTVGGIRWLPLSDDPKDVAAMQKVMDFTYVKTINPAPAYAGLGVPTKLMGYDYLIMVGAHVKDDMVYRIAKAVHDNKAGLVASFKAFKGFDPAHMYKKMPAPYHPGAVKYYKEIGLSH